MFVRKILFLFLLILIVSVPLVTLAQEVTETPPADSTAVVTLEPTVIVVTPEPTVEPPPIEEPPEETPVTTPETLLGQLYSLLKDGTYIVWASAGVVVIVGLFKAGLGALGFNVSGAGAMLFTLVVQVAIWLGYAIANYFGQGELFKSNYLILVDVGRSLLPLAGAIFGGHVLYHAAEKRNVPILGYKYIAPNSQRRQ